MSTENIVFRDATPTLDWSAHQVAFLVNDLQKKHGKLILTGTSVEANSKEYQLLIFSYSPLTEAELEDERKRTIQIMNDLNY
jgi:hypothetical protein